MYLIPVRSIYSAPLLRMILTCGVQDPTATFEHEDLDAG